MSENGNLTNDTLKKPLIASVIFHVCLLLFAIFGLPHFKKDIEMVEPVPIDMVADISELTSTNKPPVKAPPPKEPKKEEPPPPKKEQPKPPQQKEVTPPDQKELEKPEPPKEEPKEKEPDMSEILDELAPPKKEEPKKEKPKQETPKPKAEPKKEKPKEDKSEDFDSLLKNLAADEPPQPDTPPDENKLMTDPAPSPNVSKVSDVLTMSEMDALRQQLAGCWNIMSGATDAQDLSVEVSVTVNADRTVADARVVDQGRYNSDTFFRAMAESALRAVKNPRCSPLRLPADKYNLWHSMTIVFDPKEMF